MAELTNVDLHFVLSRTPKDLRDMMKEHPRLFLAGGFIRASIAGERVTDIDFLGPNVEALESLAKDLALSRKARMHTTDNARTILAPPRKPVQFITRWLFDDPEHLIESFDFTIAQAAIWWEGPPVGGLWRSICSDLFYPDLAARRLTYTCPVRNEDAGGSMLRMRKFVARGYSIQAPSLAKVIARLVTKIEPSNLAAEGEEGLAQIICGLLREVDPLIIVDGIDFVDEHQAIEGESP